MSFIGWMLKQTMVHPYHGMLFRIKKKKENKNKNKLLVPAKIWINLKRIKLSKKRIIQKLYSIWFYLYSILISDCRELRKGWGKREVGHMKDPCSNGKFPCHDLANVNILVVILYYNFQDIMRENWYKGIISYTCMRSYN